MGETIKKFTNAYEFVTSVKWNGMKLNQKVSFMVSHILILVVWPQFAVYVRVNVPKQEES